MALRLYDKAITNKIKGWIANSDTIVLSPEQFRDRIAILADKNKDKPISFPLIAIGRSGGYDITLPTRLPFSYNAYSRDKDGSDNTVQEFDTMVITINYTLYVYARYFEDADEIMRLLLFNIVNFPDVPVEIPYYNSEVWYKSSVYINSSVSPAEKVFPGLYSGLRVDLTIQDGRLWDVRDRTMVTIANENQLIIESSTTDEVVEVI